MAQFLYDSMSYTGVSDLDLHVGETGATWVCMDTAAAPDGGGAIPKIDGVNGWLTPTRITGRWRSSGVPAGTDYKVSAQIYRPGGAYDSYGFDTGVLARCQSAADTSYCFTWSIPDGKWYLFRRNAGTDTVLDTPTTSTPLTAGNATTISLTVTGTSPVVLLAKTGTTTIFNYSDSHGDRITTKGYAGLRIATNESGAGTYIDWISAEDLTAGSFQAAWVVSNNLVG